MNGRKILIIITLVLLSALVVITILNSSIFMKSNKQESYTEKEDPAEDEHDELVVKISDREMKDFGIKLSTAGPGRLRIHLNLPGEVAYDPDRVAYITPRFPGVVKEIRKHIGDHVNKGDTLAIIESNESLTPYAVLASIDGTIIRKDITLGEVVREDKMLFEIADLSHVWVNLTVYQKDLPYIRVGQEVTISPGYRISNIKSKGKISYISPVLDEETRTATARVVLPNPSGIWRPGLFVTGRVEIENIYVPVMIPKSALQTINDKTCVFVKTEHGFIPKPVEIGRSNETHVEIISGLKPGQQYVSEGAFTLKSELLKEEFGGGHGH